MEAATYTAMHGTATVGSPSFVLALLPGDCLLYARRGVVDRLITCKTWSRFTHVEVVASKPLPGVAMVAASRAGTGVNLYQPDWRGLAFVLRPVCLFDVSRADSWLKHVRGQRYDWLGLFSFFYASIVNERNNRMFCSEFATRYYREAGLRDTNNGLCDLFPEQDADTIAPRDFGMTPALRIIWRSSREWQRYAREKRIG